MINAFEGSVFNMMSLTDSINKLPTIPGRLGSMGLFRGTGIRTLIVMVEERHGTLMLIPPAARGTRPNVMGGKGKEARPFALAHHPLDATVEADDVQGLRAFGSETATAQLATIVNDKMTDMRSSHEATWEMYRTGAIQGLITDANGDTVYDLFDVFDLTQTSIDFDFSDADLELKLLARQVRRAISDALGATPFRGVHAMCGRDFYESFITSDEVKTSYERWNSNSFARDTQLSPFEWGDITWEEYQGAVGDKKFVADDVANFFPTGVTNLFREYYGPANFIETVNTLGKPLYAKREAKPMDMGWDLHTQSNYLCLCTRPAALILGELVTAGSSSSSAASSGSG